jgi:mannose-6-phosphate isomerase-like protein (cupin superfamily)
MGDRGLAGGQADPLRVIHDERGALMLADFDALPFSPSRAFVLHDIPPGARRGGHAHRRQHRFLAVVSGRARVVRDDGRAVERFEIGPGQSLHLPPGVWQELEALEVGLEVLAFASGPHDPDDYLYDRDELALAAAAQTSSA